MTAWQMVWGVDLLRKSGLAPDRVRVPLAALVLDGGPPRSPGELCARARDEGICVSEQKASETLGEFRRAGMLYLLGDEPV